MEKLENCSRCGGTVLGPYDQGRQSGVNIDIGGKFSDNAIQLVAYICISCGYVEQYISEHDIRDIKEYLRLKGFLR